MKACPKKVTVVYHYAKKDKECRGDYHYAEILFDKEEVYSLTDYYHDKTHEVFNGFINACKLIYGDEFPEVVEVNKANSKW